MSVIEAVETALVEAEQKATAVLKEVKDEVVKVEEKVRYEISETEKLFITRVENDFLKAQVEIQQLNQRMTHLQEVVKKAQTSFTDKVAGLAEFYKIDMEKFIFNAVDLAFTKKQG